MKNKLQVDSNYAGAGRRLDPGSTKTTRQVWMAPTLPAVGTPNSPRTALESSSSPPASFGSD